MMLYATIQNFKNITGLRSISFAYQRSLLFANFLLDLYSDQEINFNPEPVSHHQDAELTEKKCFNIDIPTQIAISDCNTVSIDLSAKVTSNNDLSVVLKDRQSLLLTFAEESFEQKLVNSLIRHLDNPPPVYLDIFERVSQQNQQRVITIASSCAISNPNKEKIARSIEKRISTNTKIKYLSNPNILRGIQLWDVGYKIHCDLNYFSLELS